MPNQIDPTRSILENFDASALREDVIAETRARQHHLPPISIYRWWARRAETITGAIVDAVAAESPDKRLLIADTFAGGGVIALSALLRGHQVYAQDINPWAATGLATMLTLPPVAELEEAASRLHAEVVPLLETAYATVLSDGTPATIAHTIRVATANCPSCRRKLRLFPGSLVSLTTRVDCGGDSGFTACPAGHLNSGSAAEDHTCAQCGRQIKVGARYTGHRMACCHDCGWSGKISDLTAKRPLGWEVALVERCTSLRREIAKPTRAELAQAAEPRWKPRRDLPEIATGTEARVLRRHGLTAWHDLYPSRQRVIVESLLDGCDSAAGGNDTIRRALEVAVIGSTEMAGFVSRWDSRYLKPYEAIANHRFNFTTLSTEPNVWGVARIGRGTVSRRLEMSSKASAWLDEQLGRPLKVVGPMAASGRRSKIRKDIDAVVAVGGGARIALPADSLDAVITDPPYHDDVQYGELSDLFRAWSDGDTGCLQGDAIVRHGASTATGHVYTKVLTDVFAEIYRALKPIGHLVLSYANRDPRAWISLFSALQDARFLVVGFSVVHSENETDHSKSGRRACTLDVLIDAVPIRGAGTAVARWSQKSETPSDEMAFCELVGSWAFRVGDLRGDWEEQLRLDLRGRSRSSLDALAGVLTSAG